jgi:uncharacterized damage-inducible protein DinB
MDHSLFIEIHLDQFNAVFDMLSEAVASCPLDLWDDRRFGPPIWQLAYHALDSLEFYMGDTPDSYRVATFGLPDSDLANKPGKAPSQQEFTQYLHTVRANCSAFIRQMTPDEWNQPNAFPWTGRTTAHRLTYNLRHLQHHMGAINLILANTNSAKPIPWH